jgi:hypothetical protein
MKLELGINSMWAIRILTGPQAGQVFNITQVRTTIGRASSCTVALSGSGVSKEHATIVLTEDKLIISDLNSSNGTFVNGVRVQNQKIKKGDKIALHDVIFDLIDVSEQRAVKRPAARPRSQPAAEGNLALQQPWNQPNFAQEQSHLQMSAPAQQQQHPSEQPASLGNIFETLKTQAEAYIDAVVMPGVFNLAKRFEIRWILAGFVAFYILLVTVLATIPMSNLIKSSIQAESQRRALTIARNLAVSNRQAVLDKMEISVSTRQAEQEEGVSTALVIDSEDGHVIAPANQRGSSIDKPFIHSARKENREKETVSQIDDSTVGASVPITYFNSNTGQSATAAYAVVLYDMGSTALNRGQTFSLFLQALAFASLLGALLFFFFMRLVEEPIRLLNTELDNALRSQRDHVSTPFMFPSLQLLTNNITSALTRIGKGPQSDVPVLNTTQREAEAEGIIAMISLPAIAISALDKNIIACTPAFENLVKSMNNLKGMALKDLSDQALRDNLAEIISMLQMQPQQQAMSEIPFAGMPHEVCGQAVMSSAEPIYYIISVKPIEVQGGY